MKNIDIILTTYNWPEALERTLYGYTQQTLKDFRIIIADDGSNEKTGDLIKKFAALGKPESDKLIKEIVRSKEFKQTAEALEGYVMHGVKASESALHDHKMAIAKVMLNRLELTEEGLKFIL